MATGSTAEIEEERRLLYVAMTRAKDHLEILLPQRFYVSHQPGFGDRHVYANRTRFIGNALLPYFQQISWPPPAEARVANPQAKQQALDLAARMRAMWR
jgi:DNA helicase-2/ATP-dependent DNA helicase PcrA